MTQDRSIAQTLSRGLRILEVLAERGRPMTAQELSVELGVSRPIVYRLLRTLEQHGLLDPSVANGEFTIGLGLLTLSRRVVRDLRESALPGVAALTKLHDTTSFVGIKEGHELVCIASAESESQVLAIRHREGMRLPLTGASGIAIRSTELPSDDDPEEVRLARKRGYAVSEGHVSPSAYAIAAPITHRETRAKASITLIFAEAPDGDVLSAASGDVVHAAKRISRRFTM